MLNLVNMQSFCKCITAVPDSLATSVCSGITCTPTNNKLIRLPQVITCMPCAATGMLCPAVADRSIQYTMNVCGCVISAHTYMYVYDVRMLKLKL